MSAETRLGLAVLGAALLLGALADGLLNETQLGLNYSLWIAAFVAALVLLAAWRGVPLVDGRRWMLPLLVVLGGLFSWRDSAWLLGLDLFAIMTALGLGVLHNPGVRPQSAGLGDYVRGWLTAAGAGFGGVVNVLADVTWAEVARGGRSRRFAAVARGFVVAVPLLLLFRCALRGGRRRVRPAARRSRSRARGPGDTHRPLHLVRLGERRPVAPVSRCGARRLSEREDRQASRAGSRARCDRARNRARGAQPAVPGLRPRPASLFLRRQLAFERLSADATPTIARELPALVRKPGNLRTEAGYVAQQLLDKADNPEDWRSWSWSRARANDSVSEHRAELEAFAQPELRF